jgi:mRNA-degrading endonuclease RelE of RelBE toxin-antitoxin system
VRKQPRYRIDYSPEALEHLRKLTSRQQATTLDAIDRQLTYHPKSETRNRKRMRPNTVGTWELRVGEIRVYYDWMVAPEFTVWIRAIGVKVGSVVRIGGEVVHL